MITVKATREKLVGHQTATGWTIDTCTPFVALPNVKALHRRVRVHNPATGKSCEATVLDTGPWNIDDPYVFQYATEGISTSGAFISQVRPLAEQGIKTNGRFRINGPTNGAGIDLGEAVWNALGMKDNTNVEWEFVTDPGRDGGASK